MASTFAKNAAALRDKYGRRLADPGLSSPRVRASAGTAGPLVEILSETGDWTRIHSAYDPIGEGSAWATSTLLATAPALVLVVGVGLGYALDEVERHSASTRVVVFEPERAIARLLLDRRDWRRRIDRGRLAVLVGPDYQGLAAVAKAMRGTATAPAFAHPVIERAWPSDTERAMRAVAALRATSARLSRVATPRSRAS